MSDEMVAAADLNHTESDVSVTLISIPQTGEPSIIPPICEDGLATNAQT